MTLEEFINAKNANTRTTFCSIIYNGYMFKACYSNNEHIIWDKTGNTTVYSWKNELHIPIKKLKQAMQYTIDNVLFCSECLNKIQGKYEQFFAGIYCENCWTEKLEKERKWAYSHLD